MLSCVIVIILFSQAPPHIFMVVHWLTPLFLWPSLLKMVVDNCIKDFQSVEQIEWPIVTFLAYIIARVHAASPFMPKMSHQWLPQITQMLTKEAHRVTKREWCNEVRWAGIDVFTFAVSADSDWYADHDVNTHACMRARCTATANLQACTSSWLIVGCGQPQYGNCGPVQTSTAVFHEFSWAAFYTDFQDAMTPSHSLWGLPLHSCPSETSIKMLHTPMVKMYIFPCDRKHINASLVSYS